VSPAVYWFLKASDAMLMAVTSLVVTGNVWVNEKPCVLLLVTFTDWPFSVTGAVGDMTLEPLAVTVTVAV